MSKNLNFDIVLENTISEVKEKGIVIDNSIIESICKNQSKFIFSSMQKGLSVRLIYLGTFINKLVIKKFNFIKKDL